MRLTVLRLLSLIPTASKLRSGIALENLALRQQLAVLNRRHRRPRLRRSDRVFWLLLSRAWSNWRETLVIVKPETVTRDARHSPGRSPLDSAIRRTCAKEYKEGKEPDLGKIEQLSKLRGIGPESSWVVVRELFGWRQFRNRREVASLIGVTPTPYDSGGSTREQGISKAGNRHVRAVAIEMAWPWLRYQPKSKLTKWFAERFGHAGKRARKVGIVAVARRLMIDLWRHLEWGVLPEGAKLKAQA